MEGIVDTNVVISAIIKEDINHQKARMLLLEKFEKWYIPTIVFHEFVWFLKSLKLSAKIAEKILTHQKTEVIPVEEDDIVFSVRNIKSLKDYNDFLILGVSIRKQVPLITFDEELRKIAVKFKVKIYQ